METKCELCGATATCKPAGPNGEVVCLECAKKNPRALLDFFAKATGVKAEELSGEKVADKVCQNIIKTISLAAMCGIKINNIDISYTDAPGDSEMLGIRFDVSTEGFDSTIKPVLDEALGVKKSPEESNNDVIRRLRDAFEKASRKAIPDAGVDISKQCDA